MSHTPQRVHARGIALMRDPLLNKGTAFNAEERETFGLHGFLPNAELSMDVQARRVYASLRNKETPMEKYIGLTALQDRNEQLFYRVLCDHLEEFMPIIYTPTVGDATRSFSQVFRRGRGVWITPEFKGRIRDVLAETVGDRDIRLTVATDNESILGIGDQGAGGMAISNGKLALYTAGAGIHPSQTLPVSLDVGTDNQELLDNELYIGWRNKRLRGDAYDALVDEFVQAIRSLFPSALIQWEDFRKDNALNIMERYRSQVPSFNDDIQGTGAVALAALLSAARATGSSLGDQRIVIFGAGAAGLGIARQIKAALEDEKQRDRRLPLAVLDSRGLLVDDREIRDSYKKDLAWDAGVASELGMPDPASRDLAAVVEHYKPTVLIGSSGQSGAFTEAIVRNMAAHCERPVILPFSNPTSLAEALPADLVTWTDGRALIATGSPFEPVQYADRQIKIGQGNNVFIFPGLGLGTILCGASEVTDGMISAASIALASAVEQSELETGLLFPAIDRLRDVTRQVARAVIERAVVEGVGARPDCESLDEHIKDAMWEPAYRKYVAA